LISLSLPIWFLAWITEGQLIADIAAIFGSTLMIGWFWTRIGRSTEMVRFVRIGAASLCAIQNFAWLMASFIHRFSLHQSIEESLRGEGGVNLTIESYALAEVYISLFATVLAFIGSRPGFYRAEKKMALLLLRLRQNVELKNLGWILLLLSGIELAMIGSGIIGQRTMVVEGYEEGNMPIWLVFYQSLLPGQIVFNALYLYKYLNDKDKVHSKWSLLLFVFSFAILSFLFFNRGRSALVMSLVALVYWYCFFAAKKLKIMKTILVLAVVYPILSQVLLFSNFMRSPDSGLDNYKGSAIEKVPVALNLFINSSNLRKSEGERTTGNLSTRPLVATPLALCIELPAERKSFLLGEEFINSIIWAVPGPLIPNKWDFPKQEVLLYAHFPINLKDTADSLYLSAYAEFGWFGILIYPWLLSMLWMIVLSLPRSFELSGLIVAIIVSIFFELFVLGIGEAAVVSWLVVLRAFFFWLFLNAAWRKLFPKKRIKYKRFSIKQNRMANQI